MSSKVTVFGTGIVGRCWAALFLRGGYRVCLYDVANVNEAMEDVKTSKLPLLDSFGMLQGHSVESRFPLLSATSNLEEALEKSVYVQECCPERLDLKQKVFEEMDDCLQCIKQNKTILASSSSNICASHFAKNLHARDRTLISHPINPPFAIPLVEIVPSEFTRPDVVTFTRDLMNKIGMSPVTLKKEVDGFAVNRLQYALLAEAYRLVADEVLSPEDVDTVMSQGLGTRWSFMGPFQTIDLNAPEGVVDYCERYTPGIENIVSKQDNSVRWQSDVVKRIDEAMRKETPVDSLKERIKWRDNQLMELARHKMEQSQRSPWKAS